MSIVGEFVAFLLRGFVLGVLGGLAMLTVAAPFLWAWVRFVGHRRDRTDRRREELAADARRLAEEHRIKRLQATKGRARLRIRQLTGRHPAA